jgi:Spy/CpxP family protein refolding chaperone
MNPNTKHRILIGLIIILIATNLSTIGSFYYHRIAELRKTEEKSIETSNVPGEQRTRFFRDQLNLDEQQTIRFRDINRTFNRSARVIEENLVTLRKNMIDELGSSSPDSLKLKQLAADIGNKHRELKEVTSTFYLDMREICTPEQQTKLHSIFQSMLNKENQVNLPQPGYQRGRGRNK